MTTVNVKEIRKCLDKAYGLAITSVTFLPLGADFNTQVYQVTTNTNVRYFLKLRSGEFNTASVSIPNFLARKGLKNIISVQTTKTGELTAKLGLFIVILYPYVQGENGIDKKLSDQQWIEFGHAMKVLHSADIPGSLTTNLPHETFSLPWNTPVKEFLKYAATDNLQDPLAQEAALFITSKKAVINKLLEESEKLAGLLQKQSHDYTVCHGDIHCWNLLVDEKKQLFIIDWDTMVIAPKERDLMFIGAGIGDTGRTQIEEETLFYQGYGPTQVNHEAIFYYRCTRIIEDIGVYCQHIFDSSDSHENRKQSLEYLQSNFIPGATIERTRTSY